MVASGMCGFKVWGKILNRACTLTVPGNRLPHAVKPYTVFRRGLQGFLKPGNITVCSTDVPIHGSNAAVKDAHVRCLHQGQHLRMKESESKTKTVGVSEDSKYVEIIWQDGRKSHYNATWLRYNCSCSECKQPYSGQIILDPTTLPPVLTLKVAWVHEQSSLHVLWNEVDHTGIISLDFLRDNDYSEEMRQKMYSARTPYCRETKLNDIDYSEICDSQSGLWRWLMNINEYGACLVKNVPLEKGTVAKLAGMISPVIDTIYGKTFDVVSTPNPINAAYSDVHLDFHMDLMYYESPPGLQFLHCIRFDSCVKGGESILLDTCLVAEEIKEHYPEEFRTLTKVPATFQKVHLDRDNPVIMKYQRPHIVVNHNDDVIAVNWSPQFEGPLFVSEEDVEPYYKARHVFTQILKNSQNRLVFQLQPGDLLSFNNHRMLHGRNGFELNGGHRQLEGCYINIDEYKSKYQVLNETVGDRRTVKRVGNHDYF